MSIELRHFRCFVAVAEDLSFSAAARRLYMTQQALSRIIRQLEDDLGVKLFERTTRSVVLTPAGVALLPSAQRTVAAADDVIETSRQLTSPHSDLPLRVDPGSGGLETGAAVLANVRQLHPELAVQQTEDGVPRGLDALRDGSLDVLLGLATHAPADIRIEPLRYEPILVGMASSHPLATLDQVPTKLLGDFDLLLPRPEAAAEWVELVQHACSRAGVGVRRWPGATHGSAQAAAVLRETLCVVPTVQWHDPPADLVFLPLTEPTTQFTWSIMTSAQRQPRPGLELFLSAARDVARARGWLTQRSIAD
ncbi:LysR family transcriptional regulator [Flindersiella endophytica]